MSLPVVKSLIECSDFSKTVQPYLPQLYDLPKHLIESWSNLEELKTIYLATNPMITAFAFSLFLFPVFLIISEINRNYSQVDRMWSIIPTVYNGHFVLYAHMSGLPTSRLDNLLACSCVWSVCIHTSFKEWSQLTDLPATFDVQLLEEGRLQYRYRGLQMVRSQP